MILTLSKIYLLRLFPFKQPEVFDITISIKSEHQKWVKYTSKVQTAQIIKTQRFSRRISNNIWLIKKTCCFERLTSAEILTFVKHKFLMHKDKMHFCFSIALCFKQEQLTVK